ncbi:MAG TPA: nucleoside-diphosphate sugar epimerase/dehydratase [Aggregatilinea sp.]|uniref:polysaccharide biosynthesis protein n=1 Tax=Aggregatilinea sp. TaxID=2806333 RepID=UPI002CDD1C26|nr:nucleoside-diphosphate sugar epimerase/dehydratase [Aggregatilinea sp.]HML21595.1 nucleoside-diphosphate sugar epimerase/dehydratase [Aggregatilinea sp.]
MGLPQQTTTYHRTAGQFIRIVPLLSADLIILACAYALTYAVRALTTPLDTSWALSFFATVAVGTVLALYFQGAYHRLWSRTSGHEVIVLVRASVASGVVLALIDFVLRPRPIPLSVVLVGHSLAFAGFVAVRYRSRLLSGAEWRWRAIWHQEFPQQAERVLIVGAGDAGQVTAWRLKHRAPGSTYKVIGFVDDDPSKQKMYIEGCQVLGTRDDIARLVETRNIDLIIVAIHNISGLEFRDILTHCERTKARIKLVPDVLAAINANKHVPLLRDISPEDLLGRQTIAWHPNVNPAHVSHKVVLVTGAAGSIGSELCRQMLAYEPTRLILLDNNESGLHDLFTELSLKTNPEDLSLALVDITDQLALEHLFATYRPQVVFHAAAYKHVPMLELYPRESIRVNIGGTLHVARLAQDYGAERFVLISTDKAVNPSCVMGASKRVCELLMHALSARNRSTLFTAVRFGNVLGSRGSVVPIFHRQIEAGGPVTITDKEMTRYFMSIPEAVNLVIQAACVTTGDDLFMLKMGEVVRIVDLAERMIRMRGLRPYVDIPITFTGIRPGEKLHEELHSSEEDLQSTVHPGIVQLVNRQNGLETVAFMDRVQKLLNVGFYSKDEVLGDLQSVIHMAESMLIAE